jgi:succinyl-diaminopimelate desuccinylase
MPITDAAAEARALDLACELIARRSVTPDDAGCQELMIERLMPLDFTVERLPFGPVQNFWARHGIDAPLVVFAGHTDVVPPGPLEAWEYPPFEPRVTDGWLCGRGAADMKASLAAMLIAVERFVAAHPQHRGSIGVLITSDEEGDSVDGTVRVVEHLTRQHVRIDRCIVGEPSSQERVGDTIRIGRRGSLNARLRIHGVQGHVAYPDTARNPIHDFARALLPLTTHPWDEGNRDFPPTSLQISNFNAGTGATNVIPGHADVLLNVRFSSEQTSAGLERAIERILAAAGVRYDVAWTRSAEPFLTKRGVLTTAVSKAINDVMGITPELSTSGGTSDARFIAPTGAEVIELGPCNATIHKVNERIAVPEIGQLVRIHEQILCRLLVD